MSLIVCNDNNCTKDYGSDVITLITCYLFHSVMNGKKTDVILMRCTIYVIEKE
jgi:hypothetical protein